MSLRVQEKRERERERERGENTNQNMTVIRVDKPTHTDIQTHSNFFTVKRDLQCLRRMIQQSLQLALQTTKHSHWYWHVESLNFNDIKSKYKFSLYFFHSFFFSLSISFTHIIQFRERYPALGAMRS